MHVHQLNSGFANITSNTVTMNDSPHAQNIPIELISHGSGDAQSLIESKENDYGQAQLSKEII